MKYLREFDLDAPHMQTRRVEFRRQTRCLCALYERVFGKHRVGNYWKVLVECVTHDRRVGHLDLLGVCTVQVVAGPEEFFDLSDEGKKRWALDALTSGINALISELEWDPRPFEKARGAVLAVGLRNEWLWNRPVYSPSRRMKASVFCEHDVTAFHISILVSSTEGRELARQRVLSEVPDELLYVRHLGRLRWASAEEVRLFNKSGNVVASLRL